MYTRTDNTRNIIPASRLPTSLPGPVGMVHGTSPDTHWPLYQNAGWRKFLPFEVPEGMVVVPESRTTVDDGDTVAESYEVVTVEAHEADNAKRQQTRILGLTDAHSSLVVALGGLLAKIGVEFPCTDAEVAAAYLAIPADDRPAGLLGDIYAAAGACRAVMTDSEIAAVAEVLKGMQA